MDADSQAGGTLESPAEVKTSTSLVQMWLDAISIATKEEEFWRDDAKNAIAVFRDEEKRRDTRFNILHANVETIVPAVYNSTPIPDVRRRYADKDPVGKDVSELIERGISFSIDTYDFDDTILAAVQDAELPGRGVTRVRYVPYLGETEETVDYEEVTCEHIPWDLFRRGPARRWADTPWVAFKLSLTRDELIKINPKLGAKVVLDETVEHSGIADHATSSNPPDIFKRAAVWEVWDKTAREVVFIAASYKVEPLKREKDPLGLEGFFPIPRPLYGIKTSNSQVPICPYKIYQDLAEELDLVTRRIARLTATMKARGAYDGSMTDLGRITDLDDGELVALSDVNVLNNNAKLNDAIVWWPIDVIVAVLEKLYIVRDQIKQTIYEVTGIADIMRGQTDANETLGAQKIKAQWGSLRVQRMQQEVQRYCRDLFRLKTEILASKFSMQTLGMMTGLSWPSEADKQRAQMMMQQQAQQAQMTGQPPQEPPPEVVEMLKQPSAEEVEKTLRNDAMRAFRIDVESDSTIKGDLMRNQEQMSTFLQGTAGYIQAMGPAVQAGLMPADVAVEIYAAFARNFRLGKQAEDSLDRIADEAKQAAENPEQKGPTPEQQAAQAQAQADQAKVEVEKGKLELAGQDAMAKNKLAEEQLRQKDAVDAEAAKLARDKHEADTELRHRELSHKEAELQLKQRDADRQDQALGLEATKHEDTVALKQDEMNVEAQFRDRELANSETETEYGQQNAEEANAIKSAQVSAASGNKPSKKPAPRMTSNAKSMKENADKLDALVSEIKSAAKLISAPKQVTVQRHPKTGRAIGATVKQVVE